MEIDKDLLIFRNESNEGKYKEYKDYYINKKLFTIENAK